MGGLCLMCSIRTRFLAGYITLLQLRRRERQPQTGNVLTLALMFPRLSLCCSASVSVHLSSHLFVSV